jgi:cold shock CspA family protein
MSALPIFPPVMRGTVKHVNGPQRCGTILGEDDQLRLFSFSSVAGGERLRKRQPVEFEHFDIGVREGELARAVRIRAI